MNRWKAQCLESGHAEFGGRLPRKGPIYRDLAGRPTLLECGYLLAALTLSTRSPSFRAGAVNWVCR